MQALAIQWRARTPWATPMGLLLAVAALLCAAWVAQDYADADEQAQALQARQDRFKRMQKNLGRRDAAKTVPATTAAAAGTNKSSAASIDAQLQRPWDALLRTFEEAQVKDVALLSLDVQAANKSLRLVGESKGMEPALDYVQQLRRSPQLHKVFISGQEDKPRAAVPLTRFALDASWGAAP